MVMWYYFILVIHAFVSSTTTFNILPEEWSIHELWNFFRFLFLGLLPLPISWHWKIIVEKEPEKRLVLAPCNHFCQFRWWHRSLLGHWQGGKGSSWPKEMVVWSRPEILLEFFSMIETRKMIIEWWHWGGRAWLCQRFVCGYLKQGD